MSVTPAPARDTLEGLGSRPRVRIAASHAPTENLAMFRCLTAATLALLLLAVGTAQAQPAAIYKKLTPAVAWVLLDVKGKPFESTAWVVDKQNRLAVGSCNVVADADKLTLFFPTFKGAKLIRDREWYRKNGDGIDAKLILTSPKKNLSVYQLEELPEGTPELKFAAASPEEEDDVHTVTLGPAGEPKLWTGNSGKVTEIRRLQGKIGPNPVDFQGQVCELELYNGTSGAPVVNDSGRVVGVVVGGNYDQDTGKATKVVCADVSEVKKLVADAKKKLG
jgi:hypothetical protein